MSRGKSSSPLQSSRKAILREDRISKPSFKYLEEKEFPVRDRFFYGDQRDAEILMQKLVTKAMTIPAEHEKMLYDFILETAFVVEFSKKTPAFWKMMRPGSNPVPFDYYLTPGSSEKKIWDETIEPFLQKQDPKLLRFDRTKEHLLCNYALILPDSFKPYLEKFKKKVEAQEIEAQVPEEITDVSVYDRVMWRCRMWANVRRNERLDQTKALFEAAFPTKAKEYQLIYRKLIMRNDTVWQPLSFRGTTNRLDPMVWYQWGNEMAPFLAANKMLDLTKLQDILEHDGPIGIEKLKDRPRQGQPLDSLRFQMLLTALQDGLKNSKS